MGVNWSQFEPVGACSAAAKRVTYGVRKTRTARIWRGAKEEAPRRPRTLAGLLLSYVAGEGGSEMSTLPDPPEKGIETLTQDHLHERAQDRALDLDVFQGRCGPPLL